MEASDGCKLIKILLSILDTKPSHAEKIVQHEGFFQVTLDTLGQFIFDLKAVCDFVYLCAQSQLSEKRLTFMVEYTKQFFLTCSHIISYILLKTFQRGFLYKDNSFTSNVCASRK